MFEIDVEIFTSLKFEYPKIMIMYSRLKYKGLR